MAQANVSLAQIQAFGGWRSIQAIQRYVHVQTDRLAGCVDALHAAES
jgi:site-specific recombinase XerD